MKCDYDSNAKAHIARHLFTRHSSAVINRMKKSVPAKQVKRAGPEATKGRAVPERHMRREMVKRFRLTIAERDSLNETLQGDNKKLDDLVQRSAQVILQHEEKVETHKQNETADQLAANMKKVEHGILAKHFMEGIRNMTTLKIDNVELNRKVKELEELEPAELDLFKTHKIVYT